MYALATYMYLACMDLINLSVQYRYATITQRYRVQRVNIQPHKWACYYVTPYMTKLLYILSHVIIILLLGITPRLCMAVIM